MGTRFLTRLQEALEAPELPDEDRWGRLPVVSIPGFLVSIENGIIILEDLHNNLHLGEDPHNKTKLEEYIRFLGGVFSAYPDFNGMAAFIGKSITLDPNKFER